jgi:hypothetical protein
VTEANFDRNFEIQQYLIALGYDAIPIKGIVKRNLSQQLTKAFIENGFEFDGIVDDEELKLLQKIAQQKNIVVRIRKFGATRKHLEQIMDEQTARLFVLSENNISREDAFEIVKFKGRTAAKISISMRDKGSPNDWGRIGTEGHAQRFQIQEKELIHEMADGGKYWYKFSIFIPSENGSGYHTISPFDIRDRKNGIQRDQALAFNITNNQMNFSLKTMVEECRHVQNVEGEVSDFCERPALIANLASSPNLKDQWLDFVFQIDLRKNNKIIKFWINKELMGVVNSDLGPDDEHLGFKFGTYRNNITESTKDEVIYYADIMRKNSCDKLGIDNCDAFQKAQNQNGFFGARDIVACFKEPEQGKPCPVLCKGNECEQM